RGLRSLLPSLALRADTVAFAAQAFELQREPVICRALVANNDWLSAEPLYHAAHSAVVVQVAEGSAASGNRQQIRQLGLLETPILISIQRRRFGISPAGMNPLDGDQDAALRHE